MLFRQIRRNKTRLERLRKDAFAKSIPFCRKNRKNLSRSTESSNPKFSVKPMDVEEAILQMVLLDHKFFMFRNIKTNEINVVYCRKDGNYGLLEPNE